MSQGPAPSRAAGHPPYDTKKTFSPPMPRTLPPIQDERLSNSPQNGTYRSSTLQQSSNSSVSDSPNGSSSRPAGPVGMQNLLNPSGQDFSTNTSRRRSADHFDLPSSTGLATPQMPVSGTSQSPRGNSLPSLTPPSSSIYPSHAGQPSRRIMTPHTSSVYNGHSATIGLPSGTIDATKSPFLGSQEQPLTAGYSGHPVVSKGLIGPSGGPVPNRSPPARPGSGALQLQGTQERRSSAGGVSTQLPGSQSNSPSTSYSSYSRYSRTPPAPHAVVATTQPSSFFAPHRDGKSATTTSMPQRYESKEAFGRVAGSSGHSTLQLMTLDTEQGPIQVPVDVTAASKVADEKRKRNATASHRFRQRRKEKERETSQNIAKLEHQIRELAEERDYYRLERDFFRTVASNDKGPARLPPRPPSPRQVRLAQLNGENGVFHDGHWHANEEGSRHGRNTRRRTSGYTPTTDVVPPVNPGPVPLPRFGSLIPNPSETADQRLTPNIRNTLPGPPAGAFDSATHAQYGRAWKPS